MIEYLLARVGEQFADLRDFLITSYDPLWDTLDIALVFFGLYWLLTLIKGTRAVQILVGLMALVAMRLFADLAQLMTLAWILDTFMTSAVLIIIVLFQADIRRALARVGRGVFPSLSERQESQILEEVVRASGTLAQKRVGALIVLERETGLEDLIETGTSIDGAVSKELLTSIFLPYSPLHDGAVLIQEGRLAHAGCILPLTLRTDLPEGLGTRHRAAVGITEESDAVVIVVSEETAAISVVHGGEMTRDLDGPRLRVVLTDLLGRSHREAPEDEAEGDAAVESEAPQQGAPDEAAQAAQSAHSAQEAPAVPKAGAPAAPSSARPAGDVVRTG